MIIGHFVKNGRIILQAPEPGQGIELTDEAGNEKVVIGKLADGSYGGKFVGSKLYSSYIRSGSETDTSYIQLLPGFEPLKVVENGKTALNIWASGGGMLQFYDTVLNDMVGQILPTESFYGSGGLKIQGRNSAGASKTIALAGSTIYLDPGSNPGDEVIVLGNLYVTGTMSAGGGKPARQLTENFGYRNLYARESPDVRYIVEGKAQFINGECRIELHPAFLECIEPNTEENPWIPGNILPLFEPIGDVFISEIGDTYFVVKEPAGQSNAQFFWSFSAVRKGFAGIWLEEYDTGEDTLTSNWEDEIL